MVLENKAKEKIRIGDIKAAGMYTKFITPLEENEKQIEQIKNKLSDLRKQLEELQYYFFFFFRISSKLLV